MPEFSIFVKLLNFALLLAAVVLTSWESATKDVKPFQFTSWEIFVISSILNTSN